MQKILFLLICGLLLLWSCGSTKNHTIELAFDEEYEVDDVLTVEFFDVIEDSRCPLNVECVWEGRAVIQLRLFFNLDMISILTLTAHVGNEEEAEATFSNYYFKLLAVNPYPEDAQSIDSEDYTIELRIEELEE